MARKRESLLMAVDISAGARLQTQQGTMVRELLSLSVSGIRQLGFPAVISPERSGNIADDLWFRKSREDG
jgi:hypothetical protein